MNQTASPLDFERIYVIENFDTTAGLCAHITYALNGIKLALAKNWLPVIRFDRADDPLFDAEHGDNIWDYFFEPPFGSTYRDISEMVEAGDLDPARLIGLSDLAPPGVDLVRFQWELHMGRGLFREFDRIATFAYGEVGLAGEALAAWMEHKRSIGREFTSKYVRVRPHVLAKVENFSQRHFHGRWVIGVHIRGTDFRYAFPTPPERYLDALDRILREDPAAIVFLATDQRQYHEIFRERYGERMISSDCARSDDATAPHLAPDAQPYQAGEEALVDCMLLSRTNHLLKCAAAGGEFALYFNPDLGCTDFALDSAPVPKHKKKTAFARWTTPDRPRESRLRRWLKTSVG